MTSSEQVVELLNRLRLVVRDESPSDEIASAVDDLLNGLESLRGQAVTFNVDEVL